MNSTNWGDAVEISVLHHNTFSSDRFIGHCILVPMQMQPEQPVDTWVTLQDKPDPRIVNQPVTASRGSIHLKVVLSRVDPVSCTIGSDLTFTHLKYKLGHASLDNFVFQIRFRLWSFGDFCIMDELGRRIFKVEGSWPNHFYMHDLYGRPVLDIRKRSLIAIRPSYDFYIPGTNAVVMSITHTISFNGMSFHIEVKEEISCMSISLPLLIWLSTL